MKVSVQCAAEHFEDLVVGVDSGQVVEIDRTDKPALQLVQAVVGTPKKGEKRVLGAGRAFSRLPNEDELERIDREWKREFEDGPVFPREQP